VAQLVIPPCGEDVGGERFRRMRMIRLVVVDVDGVLSHGEAAPLDFAVLQRLAEFKDRRSIDKGEGVRWLARESGIPLGDMAGVGDSPSAVRFMQLLGWSAAPINAHASVKQIAHYTSPYEDGPGLMDISTRLLRPEPEDDTERIS
jgi:3-deoxy-D-manno-octulosonate 8-phosphate phosphatase KdsC-like HAD superfamily phosphatase